MAFRRRRPMRPDPQTPGTPSLRDQCQTPVYAVRPLVESGWLASFDGSIWEPAAGDGILARALRGIGRDVIESDILPARNCPVIDFVSDAALEGVGGVCTNPPYSIAHRFLDRCYTLFVPFALLMPITVLGTNRAAQLFEAFGVEVLALRKRVNFKMPNLGWSGKGAHFSVAWFVWHPSMALDSPRGRRAVIRWFGVNEADGLEELTWQKP